MKYLTGPMILAFIGALFVASAALWAAYRQNKEKDSDAQSKAESTKRQEQVEKRVEQLLKTDELRPERLRLRYPLGFVVLEIDHSQRVIPHQKQFPPGYDIDLRDNVGFADFPPNQISVTMPKFHLIDQKGEDPFAILPTVTLPKQVGAVNCVNLIPKGNLEEAFSECAEILQVSDFGIVFLVGIKRMPLLSGFKPKTKVD